jgi:hypothetical protein
MQKLNIVKTYRSYVRSLGRGARQMEYAVGGDFEAIGLVEREILILYGLQPEHYVIDVGLRLGPACKAAVVLSSWPLPRHRHRPRAHRLRARSGGPARVAVRGRERP